MLAWADIGVGVEDDLVTEYPLPIRLSILVFYIIVEIGSGRSDSISITSPAEIIMY